MVSNEDISKKLKKRREKIKNPDKEVKKSEKSSNEIRDWWNQRNSKGKAATALVVCCLGVFLLIGVVSMITPDSVSTSSNYSSGSNVSSSTPQPVASAPAPAPVAAETESQYKASCKYISFKELEKNPNAKIGERVKYRGNVVQIMESYGLTDIRMDVNDNFGDTIYVTYDGTTSAVEDSTITVYGELAGSYSYTSQAGWEITIPRIDAKYIETK